MAFLGNTYINFGLWGVAIFPAWLIIKEIGLAFGEDKVGRDTCHLRDISVRHTSSNQLVDRTKDEFTSV